MASIINASTAGVGGVITTADNSGVLNIQTAGTTAVTVTASQNVGIGTTSALQSSQLTVYASPTPITTIDRTTNIGATVACASSGTGYIQGGVRLGAEGNSGIYGYDDGTGGAQGIGIFTGNNTTIAERMRIDASGNLLVAKSAGNVTAVGVELNADGRVFSTSAASTNAELGYRLYSTGAGAYRFYVGYGGTVYATATTITAISDQRLKENVRPLENSLTTINSLNPVRFDWKEGKGLDKKDDVGFIAQEFETVFPNSVEESRAGEDGIAYKALNHGELIPTLVKAIQELKAIVDTQAEQIKALQGAK